MIRLFRVLIPTSVVALIISELVLLVTAFVIATFFLLEVSPEVFLLYDGGLGRVMVVVLCILGGMYLQDLYANLRVRSSILLIQQVCMSLGIAFLVQALISYVSPGLMLPRWIMIGGSSIALVAMPSWRLIYLRFVLRAAGRQRLLFLGVNAVAPVIAKELRARPELGYEPVGYLEDSRCEDQVMGEYLGGIVDLESAVNKVKPELIIVGMSERRRRLPVYKLLELSVSGVIVEEAAHMYEAAFGRVCTRELRPSQLIFTSELGPRPFNVYLQGAYSFVLAAVLLVLFAPILLVVALVVKATSPGPVLYRQSRVGLRGKLFTIYKVRSMYADAEKRTGAVWAAKDDPRITPVGKWLRLLRLDEIPQLYNVLRGEMAFVGPRPERPEFVQTLSEKIPFYRHRHAVKPGITGWAQINHKYGDTLEDTITKLEYDLYYIKNLAPSLDAYIMFHTMKVMLLARGAQ